MDKKHSLLYKRYTIWLSAMIVILLITLLAYAVYRSREKSIINLFSSQQEVISDQVASMIEGTLERCEINLGYLTGSLAGSERYNEQMGEAIRKFYIKEQNVVLAVMNIDDNDVIKYAYPDDQAKNLAGRKIADPGIMHALKMFENGRYAGGLNRFFDSKKAGDEWLDRTICIGLPVHGRDGKYDGAVLALISPRLLMTRAIFNRESPINGELWLVDDQDRIAYRPYGVIDNRKFHDLLPDSKKSFDISHGVGKYFIENISSSPGKSSACIISYAPVHIGTSIWFAVMVAPYHAVQNLISSTSKNIILGAFGLIVVVIVTAISIAQSDVKRLRLKEELKRLQEREEWQSKLLREKMTIDGIIEGSPVPTFVIDKDHKVILWNRACTDLTGYSSKVMVGTSNFFRPFYDTKRPLMADFIIDQNIEDFSLYYGDIKVKKSEFIQGAYESIKYFSNLNGKGRHLHFMAAPIYNEKGEITSAIETFLDVTKEVELTRSLQEYAESLQNELGENIRLNKETEYLYNYLGNIVESLPDKIFDLSKDGIINYVSKQTIMGRDVETEIKGKHFTEFVEPQHREYMISKWENAQKGIFTPYELEVVTRKGEKRNLLITPRPVKGTDRYILVQRDITEYKELEKKFYESQKLAAIGQLSAGIAHEIRNPLSSIKMSLQILEKRLQPSGNDLQRFKIAQREVDHLEKLVSDVLIYAKPLVPNKEPSDLNTIVENALAMVEKSLKDKEIEVRKDFAENLKEINVDASMITQCLINVFQNAVEAMEDKGIMVITLKEENGNMVIEVKDNGCGIDENDMPHLFNPFFTLKNYGTGLGLSQVKKIIDQHEGEIKIISIKGEGTRFIIKLPENDNT
jgi:PAS domain S-box-containing protein